MIKEFKEFITKGNLIDLALAFHPRRGVRQRVVSSFTFVVLGMIS